MEDQQPHGFKQTEGYDDRDSQMKTENKSGRARSELRKQITQQNGSDQVYLKELKEKART